MKFVFSFAVFNNNVDGFLHLFDCDPCETLDRSVVKSKGVAALVLFMIKEATMKPRGDLHPLAMELTDKPSG